MVGPLGGIINIAPTLSEKMQRWRAPLAPRRAAEFSDLSRFAVMQHIGVLEEATLLIPRRQGRTRLNYLNPVPIQRIYQRWVSKYQEPWTEALVSLKGSLESESQPKRRRRAG